MVSHLLELTSGRCYWPLCYFRRAGEGKSLHDCSPDMRSQACQLKGEVFHPLWKSNSQN